MKRQSTLPDLQEQHAEEQHSDMPYKVRFENGEVRAILVLKG